ncbi:zinc finger 271-like, partial [Paramuricea clavata]
MSDHCGDTEEIFSTSNSLDLAREVKLMSDHCEDTEEVFSTSNNFDLAREETFSQSTDLVMHEALHLTTQIISEDSTELFPTSSNFDFTQNQETPNAYECNVCKEQFCQLSDLEMHKTLHLATQIVSDDYVELCSASSDFAQNEGTLNAYECDICKEKFCHLNDLEMHKALHLTTPITSNNCAESFLTSSNQDFAQEGTHNSYECDACKMTFSQSEHLENHKRTHTVDKPYGSDVCNERCSQSADLGTHETSHLTTESQPDLCEDMFSTESSLDSTREETVFKPFECDDCKMKFSQLENLEKHKRTHIVDKPYECDV